MKLRYSLLFSALVLAGCTSLAPEYSRPQLPVAAQWPSAVSLDTDMESVTGLSQLHDLGWRSFITHERLKQVIELALENNRDLQKAVLNIERARALHQIQSADQLPGLSAQGSLSRQHTAQGTSSQYGASLASTSFELDFFGRIASLNEQALQRYLASEFAMKTVQVSLISQVATAYLEVAAQADRLMLAKRTLSAHEASYRLTRESHALGAVPLLAVTQSQSLVEAARGDVARYSQQLEKAKNALTLLVGAPIDDALLPTAGKPMKGGQLVLEAVSLTHLQPGISSEALLWRPDIIAAEHTLKAANANIGAARAALYPRITLTGALGSASSQLGDLFGGGSGVWSFLPQVSLPIFDGGRSKANIKVAKIDQKIALADYEKTVQTAFREVADALAERATLGDQLKAQEALVAASQHSLKLAQARFNQGLDSHLVVLDAQRSLYSAQQGLITLRLAQQINRIVLYKALGGGQSA